MRAKADFHIKRGQERSLDTANIVKANEIFKRERERDVVSILRGILFERESESNSPPR